MLCWFRGLMRLLPMTDFSSDIIIKPDSGGGHLGKYNARPFTDPPEQILMRQQSEFTSCGTDANLVSWRCSNGQSVSVGEAACHPLPFASSSCSHPLNWDGDPSRLDIKIRCRFPTWSFHCGPLERESRLLKTPACSQHRRCLLIPSNSGSNCHSGRFCLFWSPCGAFGPIANNHPTEVFATSWNRINQVSQSSSQVSVSCEW